MWDGYASWFLGVLPMRSLPVHPSILTIYRYPPSCHAGTIRRPGSADHYRATSSDAPHFSSAKDARPGIHTIDRYPPSCRAGTGGAADPCATSIDTAGCPRGAGGSAALRDAASDLLVLRNAHGSRDHCVPPL